VGKAAMVAATSAATVAGRSGVDAGVAVGTSAAGLTSGKGVSAASLQATAKTVSSASTLRTRLFGIARTFLS